MLQCKPTKCTNLVIITIMFHIHKLLHVSGLTGPSSGSVQLYTIIVRAYYHLQCVELISSIKPLL